MWDEMWDEYQENFRRIKKDALAESVASSGFQTIWAIALHESLSGDPSFLRYAANRLAMKLAASEEITPMERYWLVLILRRACQDNDAALVLSGKPKRGAPKKGQQALFIAIDVLRAIIEDGPTSVEAAWDIVADRCNVDASTVKKYWVRWKPKLAEGAMKNLNPSHEGIISFDDMIKRMLKTNGAG